MDQFLDWLFSRLTEKSTWIGIATTGGTLLGMSFSPENAEMIATAGVSIAGLALSLFRERKSPA